MDVEFISKLPIVLNEKMIDCLNLGLFYSFGRDRCLRPILIFRPKVSVDHKIQLEDAIQTSHFVLQYVIENMMFEGKVENFITILDSEKLSFTQLPKMWIVSFVNTFNHFYYQRNVWLAILNAHWSVNMLYAIAKPFLHETTKKKTIFSSENTWDTLTMKVDPKQLEEKYGGEAENLKEFWPPWSSSNNYGIDENYLDFQENETMSPIKTINDTIPKRNNQTTETDNIITKIQDDIKLKAPKKSNSDSKRKEVTKKEWVWKCSIF